MIDRDHAGARARLDRHVANRHPRFHRQRAHGLARELDCVAGTACSADATDDRKYEIFRRDPGGQAPVDTDQHRLRLLDQQALRGQHVFDFGRADAERERRKRAVGAGVRVAADNRHAGQRRALLGADHVDDALPLVQKRKIGLGPVLADVAVQRFDLHTRNRVLDATIPVLGRRVVVGRGHHRLHAPRLAARELQSLEGLRARHFMDEMPVDVEQRRAIRFFANHMGVPQLVIEGACGHGLGPPQSETTAAEGELLHSSKVLSGSLPVLGNSERPFRGPPRRQRSRAPTSSESQQQLLLPPQRARSPLRSCHPPPGQNDPRPWNEATSIGAWQAGGSRRCRARAVASH